MNFLQYALYSIRSFAGTSMACPHVCGLITALLDKTDGYLAGEF